MIKDQFATYEISLKLKELGFNEECLAIYINLVLKPIIQKPISGEFNYKFKSVRNSVIVNSENCSAPLWQQVIGWLREKHGLLIHIDGKFKVRISNNTRESIGHVFTKDLQKSRHTLKMNGSVCPHLNYLPAGDSKHLLYPKNEYSFILEFPSYEEAQEYAILKAIELIS